MLRDAVSIFTVVSITAVLFGVTLFLFRSFTAHRADLAQRWSDRGRRALQTGRASEAIVDLRTALLYAPGRREYELLLAQALGAAGMQLHQPRLIDESYTYYLGLWESAPGDGNINLELARLAAHKGNREEAVHYYRAAIYGTWEQGDGVRRRADVRTELARYFIDQHDFQNARTELLIAGGNTPDTYERDISFGRLLESAQYPADAESFYRKAIALRPNDPVALELAGQLAYNMADYTAAHRLLQRAAEQHAPDAARDTELAQNAGRILALAPAPSLPPRERATRVLEIRTIAKKRYDACIKQQTGQPPAPPLQTLAARWASPDATVTLRAMLLDPARQDAALQLAYDSERELQSSCGAGAIDDAIVLKLAAESRSNSGNTE